MFWTPLGLALLNTVALLAIFGFDGRVVTVAGLGLIAAFAYSWWLSRHMQKCEEASAKRRQSNADLQTRCVRALPIWMRQIESTRNQTEKSVTAQATCFSGIVEQLGAALTASQKAAGGLTGSGDDGIVAVIKKCEQDLASVIEILSSTQRSRDALFNEVRGLVRYAAELERMTADVTELAKQTTLLAWNGAIEATRAGHAGNSFSVVASQMRKLSDRSSETVRSMSKSVAAIKSALSKVSQVSEQFSQQDGDALHNTESIINGVSGRFQEVISQLAQSARLMQQESRGIRDEISQVIVSLQYQDRVSQILNHITLHMDELQQELEKGGGEEQYVALSGAVEVWLDKMQRTYSTEEQHREHHGITHEPAASASQNITYF